MDDFSPKPIAPSFDYEEVEQEQVLDQETKQLADSYYHPAWIQVENMFVEELERLSLPVARNLPAEEYKIEGVANEKVAAVIKSIWKRVQDAVEATESKRGGQ